MDDVISYKECWAKTTGEGKPGISVRDHCLNVGCVAEALLALLAPQLRRLIPPGAAILAALHDVGKVSPGFQSKSEAWLVRHALRDQALKQGWCERESDHAKISQFTVQELLRTPNSLWAAVVGAHHGRIKGERLQVREPWGQERERLAAELIEEFGQLPDRPSGEAPIWFVAGLITVADWIGSDERHFSQHARWAMLEVIILSATLTERRRRELLGLADHQPVSAAYPLVSGLVSSCIEHTCEAPPSKTIQIRNIFGASPVEEAIDRARCNECVLWIRNTVDESQQTYRALQSATFQGGPSIALLHSRFPFFRREQLEEEWMIRLGKDSANRPIGCVLVSTQVAEQSVDIDADMLITDLAPTDMLLQRLGRLWRHDRPTRPSSFPEVWIQMPQLDDATLRTASKEELRRALGKSARIYAPYVLLRSLQQWSGRATVTLPGDIRSILEATYADSAAAEPRAWQELRDRLEEQREHMARLALSSTAIWNNPALPDEEGVQTRFSTYPMAQLLLATEITPLGAHSTRLDLLNGTTVTASDRDWSFDVAKAIYRNIVRVPRWAIAAEHFEHLIAAGTLLRWSP